MKTAIVQINGGKCPRWQELAKQHNIQTVWFEPTLDPVSINPDLVILQCAAQWYHLETLNYHKLSCPIVISCGDAACITNLNAIFHNLSIITHAHVEGYDYIERYQSTYDPTYLSKLHFQKLCSDTLFPIHTPTQKLYDWSFIGQVYPAYDVRIKHYRNQIIKDLLNLLPNGFIAGTGWDTIGLNSHGHLPQNTVNEAYARSRLVVSVDAHDGTGYTSTRTIEAMHGGHVVAIYDHAGMHYLKQWVQDGIHAFYFKDVLEIPTILNKISNPEILTTIQANATALIRERGWTHSAWLQSAITLMNNYHND